MRVSIAHLAAPLKNLAPNRAYKWCVGCNPSLPTRVIKLRLE